ncbi:hypothetical protein PHMEG_0007900 [Phytophthora megakarya]|uniref:Uncharacterized protein n=1 Tax=Phytophthora megakarya TaxID=4795 RepID=A0A225WLD8_9STRA|nr:hypothetical protein PHMEG_0007900 [Phytophthora megakarya]
MKVYHQYMGGVDPQRYSLQLSLRFRKYYKSLALGLIDMTIVNRFIIFPRGFQDAWGPPADHASFITQLHAQLLAVGATEFADTVHIRLKYI